MKAKEYYNKYGDALMSRENGGQAAVDMLLEMSKEMSDMMNTRHVKKNEAVIGAIREGNAKWNSVCNMIEKNHGVAPLVRDAFKTYWAAKLKLKEGTV